MEPTNDELSAWLTTHPRQYSTGVELYARLPTASAFLLGLFRAGADDYNRTKLAKALQAELDGRVATEAAKVAAYPTDLTAELQEAGKLMDLRTALKERCRCLADDSSDAAALERETSTLRILEIGDRLSVIYCRKAFYDKHGYFPQVAEAVATPLDVTRRISTLRTYVSRLESELATSGLTAAKRDSACRRLAQYRTELTTLLHSHGPSL